MSVLKWNNRPGQAEGEERSELRRVATSEVVIHGRTYGIEIQCKATGNSSKAYRVSTDLPSFISDWMPTLSSAKDTAVKWTAAELQTKAQNVWNAQWWIAVQHTRSGRMAVATIVGGLCDTTRGRISITSVGDGWRVAQVANNATWDADPTVVWGGLHAYTMGFWDAIETAAKWVASKQAVIDAAITDAMLATAKADAEAAALVRAEEDTRGRIVRNAAILVSEALAAAHALPRDASEAEVERARAHGLARAYARMEPSTDAVRARSVSEAGTADAQWAREVEAEQKVALARAELAIALANGDVDTAHALATRYPQFRPLIGLRLEE